MDKYFNIILQHQAKIEMYSGKIREIEEKIEKLKIESHKIQDNLIKERKELTDLTQTSNAKNTEMIINIMVIFIFLLSIGGLFPYSFKEVSFFAAILKILKRIGVIFIINSINLIIYKISKTIIKNHFSKIKENNKEQIEVKEKEIEYLNKKNFMISTEKSKLINRKYELQGEIQKEKNIIFKINKILIEELAPFLDDLIEREINENNQNVKKAIENIARKLETDKPL